MAWYIYEKLILKFNIFKNIYFKMFKFHLNSWFSKRVSTTQNSREVRYWDILGIWYLGIADLPRSLRSHEWGHMNDECEGTFIGSGQTNEGVW